MRMTKVIGSSTRLGCSDGTPRRRAEFVRGHSDSWWTRRVEALGGVWKGRIPLCSSWLPRRRRKRTCSGAFSKVFLHSRASDDRHALSPECAPRIADEDSMDVTYKTLAEFCKPTVPELQGLKEFLLKKPDGCIIRVSPRTYKRVRDYDLQGLFEPSNGDRCFALEEHLAGCVLQPETGASRLSFVHAWDNLINKSLRLFLSLSFTKDRNTNTAIPSLVGYVGDRWSLWTGEEGGAGSSSQLFNKRKWYYKTIPYILGYHASGLAVTLVALYNSRGDGRGEASSMALANFNLHDLDERIRLFMVMLNIARVLGGLHEICVKNNEGSEFELVKAITTGKSVTLAGDLVVKGYQTEEKRMKVWKVYSALRGCPNMEKCLSGKPAYQKIKRRATGEYTLRFSPRLSRTARATTQESLVRALLDVAGALAWLRRKGWIHRDVHWGNVAWDEATGAWTLIDAEEACTVEQAARAAHPLNSQSHAPEMLSGCHGTAVDVWGLGYLIRTASDVSVASKLVDDTLWELSEKCMAMDPAERPSIAQCQSKLESCLEKILSDECMNVYKRARLVESSNSLFKTRWVAQ
ncbi:uncharacterized protein LOC112347946 [Selaginella moellendorffii]|uniref:uncharacterized protein LOC112347946 n=1 Tax=Selaginella moellendorffii TaxID=88036 RepID=UPI000D1CB12E|nr:uncharacterized protein LOC112347946 [Selaginella moellendorffii]|eukprot:XP_024535503.1 uncharacterized protein LOC112347946 [Selaginella moellendorffii]